MKPKIVAIIGRNEAGHLSYINRLKTFPGDELSILPARSGAVIIAAIPTNEVETRRLEEMIAAARAL